MLQTRHFRYFVAVAEELNFHRAAERMHVSQPALWRQIRDLEAEVGTELLLRDPRGIKLTPAGAAFLKSAHDILERIENAKQHARRVSLGEVGHLDLAINEIAGRRPEVPLILQAFRKAHPEITLQLHFLMSQMQIDGLRAGTLDGGFLLRHESERSDFQTVTLGHDTFSVALPREHRLISHDMIRLQDLKGETLIMPNPRNNTLSYTRITALLHNAGVDPQIAQFADNENTIMNLVAAGMGLAFLNTSLEPEPSRQIVLRRVVDLDLRLVMEFAWPRGNSNPALPFFIAAAQQVLSDFANG